MVNPTIDQFDQNGLNLLVSGKKESINMIEMDGNEIDEQTIEKAFVLGQEMINRLCDIQQEFLNKFVNKKDLLVYTKYNYPSDQLKSEVAQIINHDQLQRLYK